MSTFIPILYGIIVHFILSSFSSPIPTDYGPLMAFKAELDLPLNSPISTNWTTPDSMCSWIGVSCSHHHRDRVIALRLPSLSLSGKLSPAIVNLTHLIGLDLSNNNFSGFLPPTLGSLHRLQVLNLSMNALRGHIPSNMTHLVELDLLDNFLTGSVPGDLGNSLQFLGLDQNNLTGTIPASLGNLSRLEYLYFRENDLSGGIPGELGKLTSLNWISLFGNHLIGSIPPSLFNISSLRVVNFRANKLSGDLAKDVGERLPDLQMLVLSNNMISGKIPASLSNASKLTGLYFRDNDFDGEIPRQFGMLKSLQSFDFELNKISGTIPQGLFNISSLKVLNTRHNYLFGKLPNDLGNHLASLQDLVLSENQFTGVIPSSICNATRIINLEATDNNFTGPIPMMLGNLAQLEYLNLEFNSLVNNPLSTHLDFLDSLTKCRKLESLVLDKNPLYGILPQSVGNLSENLRFFAADSCQLKGSIPIAIGNMTNLYLLGLDDNNLQGEVPSSLSGLQSLERLYLEKNRLEGNIPTALCSMVKLGLLHLGKNRLSGSIPECIRNLTELNDISLTANHLNSSVPSTFWELVNLQVLNLSRNGFHSVVPIEFKNMKQVRIIDLSSNNFSSEIPNSMDSLQFLEVLDLSQNKFRGTIPNSLSKLVAIKVLDLSSNNLSSRIPASLGSLHYLEYLNLSFNMLEGEIPDGGVFTNISFEYLMGNPGLCGSSRLNLSSCPSPTSTRARRKIGVLKITIPVVVIILLLIVTCIVMWNRSSKKKYEAHLISSDLLIARHRVITYYELVRATENFSEINLVGKGSSGMVYKTLFSDGTIAAVKVFDAEYAGGLKNFEVECEVLKNVRHRKLVKIISVCSNLEFKAMVLEYMPHGSLEKWLYSESHCLSLIQRLDILIDVAEATAYLHHEYVVPIVHCDLKPSNVLLDEDRIAHVADFGIAKILAGDEEFVQTKTLGTMGYIAPEYGSDGHVSTKGDVYSFGIMLLETFTRRRPTDEMFREELNLHEWVEQAFHGNMAAVIDSNLIFHVDSVQEGSSSNVEPFLMMLMQIVQVGFLCLKEMPEERIDMREVAIQLKKIRKGLRRTRGW